MSELINNSDFRKSRLKDLILKLHQGEDPVAVRKELLDTLGQITKFISQNDFNLISNRTWQ